MDGHLQELLLEPERHAGEPDLATRWLPLVQRLQALGWIHPEERLLATESAGEGNMNRTLRVRLGRGSTERSLVLKQALPYVAKYPDIAAPIERGAVEAAFYTTTSEHEPLKACMPRLLGFDPAAHLLALEDLGQGTDFSVLYVTGGRTSPLLAHLPSLVNWLAQLHRMPVSPDFPSNAAMRTLNHAHLFVVPFAAEAAVALSAPLAELRGKLIADAALMHRLEQLGDRYLGRTQDEDPQALLHGDFYPGSWLLDRENDARVIDPEFAFVGPREFDLGVLSAHLTLAGVSNPPFRALLDAYEVIQGPIRGDLLDDFAAVEILRRVFGVAQLPLTLTPPELIQRCTAAWHQLSR
ncbi:MAG: phosphotransferase [Pseudomonadota bacterium]